LKKLFRSDEMPRGNRKPNLKPKPNK